MNTRVAAGTNNARGWSRLVLLGLLASGGASLGGCLHANLPGSTENTLAATDPNVFPAPKLMALSLEYVANRYPPAGGAGDGTTPTFAFNLPEGMRPENYDLVQSMLEGHGVPVTPENATTLPVYHIATMWIRGSRAQVEMVYPVQAVGLTPGSEPVYRGVSLELATDLSPWRVRRQQLWNVGTIPVPPLHFREAPPPTEGEGGDGSGQTPAPAGESATESGAGGT